MVDPAPPPSLALQLAPGSVVLSARAVALCRAGLRAAIDVQRQRQLPLPADAVALLAELDGAVRTAAGPAIPTSRLPMSGGGPPLAASVLPDASSRPSMTVQEAAAVLEVKDRQVRRLLADGALRGQKVGPVWTVDVQAVAARRAARSAA